MLRSSWIGRYKLLQRIGEGGCGVVYAAEQEEPIRRRVALKVIKLGMDTKSVIARFEAERQALALMDHPNIAKVFDAGATETGRPFFVMELVRGVKITDYCDRNSLSTRERLDLFVQVCRAIQHAHQKGIIHRDIKPSNVLVTLHDSVPVPKVIDFGIAKATSQQRLTDKTLYTAFEQFIGTPAYMSPEQAQMSGLDIDTRSDIYSLGVLLYELLTGKTPFDAQTLLAAGLDEMRRIIREQEPVRPSARLNTLAAEELTTTAKHRHAEPPKLIHLLRGDLDWIAMKCLEKDRIRRYETANGLAADIQRHLEHEPVVARPPSTAYRVRKFVRRNKLMVTAGAAVTGVLVLGILVSTSQAMRAKEAEREQTRLREAAEMAHEEATAQRESAVKAKAIAEQQAYAANINLAHQAWQESNLGRVSQLLAQTRPKSGEQDQRGWEWRYLWGLAQGDEIREVARFEGQVWNLACAESNGLVAVGLQGQATEDRGGFLYELGLDRLSHRRLFATNSVSVSVFLPRGGSLLSNRPDDRGRPGISVLDAITLQETARLQTTNEVTFMVVSRDGRWLASLERVQVVPRLVHLGVWNTEDWSRCWSKPFEGDGLRNGGRVEFLGDDRQLAGGTEQGEVTIFEAATGKFVRKFSVGSSVVHSPDVLALAYVPASRLLAVSAGYRNSSIGLWNLGSGERARELTGHQGWIADLEVSPDGRWLASASADQTVRLWDISSPDPVSWTNVVTLRGHEDEVICLAFSPDGKRLLTGADRYYTLWEYDPQRLISEFPHQGRAVRNCNLSSRGDFAMAHWDGSFTLVRAGARLEPTQFWPHRRGLCDIAFTPDGSVFATAGAEGIAKLWDAATCRCIAELESHLLSVVWALDISPDGRLLATASGGEKAVKLWDLLTHQELMSLSVEGSGCSRIEFSRDGNKLVGLSGRGYLHIWHAPSWKEITAVEAGKQPELGPP